MPIFLLNPYQFSRSVHTISTMTTNSDSGKSYHRECTGEALETAKAHGSPKDITMFGSCFCPFVQRVWIALEFLGIDYKVCLVASWRMHTY